jgi:type II secretory pathway pseudopilin PulG
MRRGARRGSGAEDGMALVVTLLVLLLVSVLMTGFVTAIVSDQRSSGLDRDQTQAYAAAHAGLEKLTSDLSALFTLDFSPSATQINALTTSPPALPGFTFIAPDNSSGYTISFNPDAQGNPAPADVNGSTISSGPYQGFRGIITPYDITVTARSQGGAEVRMRRTLQTVAIPVFQFGLFSENDLSFFAGPNFNFGGRVHTNSNLFLAEGNGSTLTLADRATAVGEVIRTNLSNGWPTSSNYTGAVRALRSPGVYRNLAANEGSLVGTLGSAANEPLWTNLSIGTYASNIRNGRTGARRLDLPLVSQGAKPIDIIRRPAQNSSEDTTSPLVYQQRFFGLAGIRILLSDTAQEILSLPTVTSTAPVQLLNQTVGGAPLAVSGGPTGTPSGVYYSAAGEPLLNGFIKIERRDAGGTWVDVTADVLGLGIAARNLTDNTSSTNHWNAPGNSCPSEPQPNAVIRLQRVRDVPASFRPCGISGTGNMSANGTDYWPLALYDTREGNLRDNNSTGSTTLALGGVMNYVELDVNNLRRYLAGQIGTLGSTTANDNGFIVYFSDRRNNKNAGVETGEYGFEDVVNPGDINGVPNGIMDAGEDINGSGGTVETYGRRGVNAPSGAVTPFTNGSLSTTAIPSGAVPVASIARANRPVHFRRALKIVNGGGTPILPGLTIASENPVYVQGNYNSLATDTTSGAHGAYAVIADAVTVLSNNWNDIRSFTAPNDPNGRPATTTGYRMAVIAGKGLSFPRPTNWSPYQDFGTDGGAHNFLRYLEDWGGQTLNYRGSIVSFYTSRQAVGTYKCCNNVYSAPTRGYNFDTEFLTPSLLPPGTPMFRDINTLTFRQLLRPTQ